MRAILSSCFLWIAFCGALIFSSSGFADSSATADNGTNTTDSLTLQQVTVTGARLEEELPQALASTGVRVEVIGAEDIKNGGYLDVATALQALAPGLYISSLKGPFDYADISLQGSRTADVLWMVDGIRMNNRLYAGTTPLDTLPSSMIERIEVLEGGQALFYGTQAIAGAVNIVTKSFSKTADGAITVTAGSRDTEHLDAFFRDGLGPHEFVVWGSADRSDGFQPFPTSEFQPSSTFHTRGYEEQSAGLKYAFSPNDALRISTTLQHTNGRLEYPGASYIAEAYNQRDDNIASVKVDFAPSEVVQVFAKAYGHWWFSHYTEFDNEIGNPGVLDVIDDHDFWGYRDYGLNLVTKIAPKGGLEYVAGYDLQRYSGNDAVLVIDNHSEQVNAVFGQIRTTPDLVPWMQLAAGARYNHPSVGQSATVWNASGRFEISPQFFARMSAGTAFRLPTAEELFANDPRDERGNPNLKPERSRTVNASFGGDTPIGDWKLHFELIGFYRDTRDLIDYLTHDESTDQDVFGNVPDKVTARGGELVVSAALSSQFSATADYTLAQTREQGSDLQYRRIPRSQAKFALDYHPADLPFGASLVVNHVGPVYEAVADLGRFAYGGYTVVDLGARFFIDSVRRHRLGLQLDNVLNKTYYSRLGAGTFDSSGDNYVVHSLGMPRTVYGSYTYAFH